MLCQEPASWCVASPQTGVQPASGTSGQPGGARHTAGKAQHSAAWRNSQGLHQEKGGVGVGHRREGAGQLVLGQLRAQRAGGGKGVCGVAVSASTMGINTPLSPIPPSWKCIPWHTLASSQQLDVTQSVTSNSTSMQFGLHGAPLSHPCSSQHWTHVKLNQLLVAAAAGPLIRDGARQLVALQCAAASNGCQGASSGMHQMPHVSGVQASARQQAALAGAAAGTIQKHSSWVASQPASQLAGSAAAVCEGCSAGQMGTCTLLPVAAGAILMDSHQRQCC